MSTVGVTLFYTTSAAFRAEKVLRAHGLVVKLIPTPRELSTDCGTALQFVWEDGGRVASLLAGARVEIAGIHTIKGAASPLKTKTPRPGIS